MNLTITNDENKPPSGIMFLINRQNGDIIYIYFIDVDKNTFCHCVYLRSKKKKKCS